MQKEPPTPDTEIKYRSLSPTHIADLLELWAEAGLSIRPQGRDEPQALSEQMADSHCHFIGAFSGGRLIGVIIANHEGRKGWLNRIAVHPNMRGRGIAMELIRLAEKWFDELGIKITAALIEDHNGASVELFKKAGYALHRDIYYLTKRESPKT